MSAPPSTSNRSRSAVAAPPVPRWWRIGRAIVNTIGLLIGMAATVFLLAWLTGRFVTDRYGWSQWLWWIPTPSAIGAVLAGLLAAYRPGFRSRHRRGRVRRWLIMTMALLAYFVIFEHRFLSPVPSDPPGLRFAHWNLMDSVVGPERFANAVVDIDADVMILANATSTRWHQRVQEWLGDGHRPRVCGPFTVLTRLPLRQLRVLALQDNVSVAVLELDTTETLGRPLVVYLFDLPSDPRADRNALAQRIGTILSESSAPPPDVALGDFNITRGSASLSTMLPGLRHAFGEAGHGYGATFHRRFPLFHIDHILLADSIRCARYDLISAGVGRHLAQQAWLTPAADPSAPPGATASGSPPMKSSFVRFLFKVIVTALLIALISEVASRTSLLGALLASLPVTSIGAMIWMHTDGRAPEAIATLSTSIFWLVLPSLVLFLVLPALLKRQVAFPLGMTLACAATVVAYGAMVLGLNAVGVKL